jgi:hypothetical protein
LANPYVKYYVIWPVHLGHTETIHYNPFIYTKMVWLLLKDVWGNILKFLDWNLNFTAWNYLACSIPCLVSHTQLREMLGSM